MKRQVEILFALALLIVLVYAAMNESEIRTSIFLNTTTTTTHITTTTQAIIQNRSFSTVSLNVPAVDNEGNGVVVNLKVEAKPGQGRVLTDINNLFFWIDTQNSIRIAQRVAQNITKTDLAEVDLIYEVQTNASLIEGPSAGAALTVATVATLQNKAVDPEVMITGTVNPDGTIGPVGGIVEKAKAAKEIGAKLFLVPKDQSVQKIYTPVEKCDKIGPVEYCTTQYKSEKINVTSSAGIEVKEVNTIEEALKYFLK
jgi:uncharacterized protein